MLVNPKLGQGPCSPAQFALCDCQLAGSLSTCKLECLLGTQLSSVDCFGIYVKQLLFIKKC